MAAKRQLLLELLARDNTGPATKGAAENLDTVAESADEAAKATDHLGRQAEESKEEVERFGKSNKTAAEHADALKHEIELVEHELHQLAVAFAEAETAADRADYSKAIRKTQSDLRKLNQNKGLVEDLVPKPAQVEQEMKKLAPSFGKQLSELWSQAGEIAGPALGIAAAASAPFIGAVISGAVVGGIGIGGIAGGLLLAAKDPRVSSALDAFKKETGDRLKDAAAPFVPVAIDGIHKIDDALKGINFEGLFSDAAKEAGPLIHGVISLVSDLGSAFTDLVHNAGPEIAAIGDGIGDLGHALENGLESLSDNGEQGAQALRALFGTISVGTQAVFGLINVLTETYGWLEKIHAVSIFDLFGKITEYQHAQALGSQAVAAAATAMASSAVAAAVSNDRLAKSSDKAAGAALGQRSALVDLANEQRAQIDPAFAVLNAQDQLAKAHKASAEAIKKYGANSDQAKAATQNLAEAALTLQGDVGALGGSFNGKLTPAMKNTLHAAGLTDGEIKNVEKQMKAAKKAADAYAKTYTAHVQVVFNEPIGKSYLPGGADYNREAHVVGGGHRAAGGPVRKGEAYVVGEHRPELFVPDSNGTIIPSIDQFKGASGAGPSSGGGGGVFTIDLRGADTLFGQFFAKLLRTQPGLAATVKQYVS